MKYTEMHEGFAQKEIRDFLGKEISETWATSSVDHLEKEIKKLQVELETARRHQALIALMKHMGWEDFDVSDFVERIGNDCWPQFVGTKKDYEQFMGKVKLR